MDGIYRGLKWSDVLMHTDPVCLDAVVFSLFLIFNLNNNNKSTELLGVQVW